MIQGEREQTERPWRSPGERQPMSQDERDSLARVLRFFVKGEYSDQEVRDHYLSIIELWRNYGEIKGPGNQRDFLEIVGRATGVYNQ